MAKAKTGDDGLTKHGEKRWEGSGKCTCRESAHVGEDGRRARKTDPNCPIHGNG